MKTLLVFLASLLISGREIQKVQTAPQTANLNTVFVGFHEDTTDAQRQEAVGFIGEWVESAHHYEYIPTLSLLRLTPEGMDRMEEVNALVATHPSVQYTEADAVFTATTSEVIPNDSGFSQCWGHRNTGSGGGLVNFDMNTTNAWAVTKGSPTIKILVFETGIQQDHPDINQLPGRDFTTGAVSGVAGGGPSNACDNHGTAVAGCIAGIINNSIGTVGVAPDCKVISAKVGTAITPCSGSWQGQVSWTVNAINWAIGNGVRVTNNSNDYGTPSTSMTNAYTAARNAGVVHFASSGNSGNTTIGYPASAGSVNAVGASSRNGQRANFSSYGNKLAFVAAGQSIYTTDRTGSAGYGAGDYTTIDGTSFSSPYAAGVAALILSVKPTLTAAEVESVMRSTCKEMGASGFDTLTGWGMLDADAAVRAVLPQPCPADLTGDRSVNGDDLGRLLSAWGTGTADLTGDSVVDGNDLGRLLAAWGECP